MTIIYWPYQIGRFCRDCGEFKLFHELVRGKRAFLGFERQCKQCKLNYKKDVRKRRHNPPQESAYSDGMIYLPYPVGKVCKHCKQWKPFHELKRRKSFSWGFRPECINCYRALDALRKRELRIEHPEMVRAQARRIYAKRVLRGRENRRASNRKYRNSHAEQVRMSSRVTSHNHRAKKMNIEGRLTKGDINRQYERQKGKCYYCKTALVGVYEIEHIIPLARGGSNWPENIVITCLTCNRTKGGKLPHEWPDGGKLL